MIPYADRPKVNDMNAQQIHTELVADAMTGVLTPLDRFVAGCERISELRAITADDAYVAIRDEVLSLGGMGVFMS